MDTFSKIRLHGWRQFNDIDIDLGSNVTVLTGPNGCGKTTILNVLARHFGWNINFISSPYFEKKSGKKLWSDLKRSFEYESEIPANQTEVESIGSPIRDPRSSRQSKFFWPFSTKSFQSLRPYCFFH
jgi:predicted ATP-binding protein involved in virulence